MEQTKCYVVLTEFNEWVGTFYDVSLTELKEEVKQIRQRLVDDGKPADTKIVIFEINPTSFSF